MPDLTLSQYQWLTLTLIALAIVIAILAWRVPKRPSRELTSELGKRMVYPGREFPTIQATNGVPTLDQLAEGIEMGPKAAVLARRLYATGLEQFNHYVNNRDGVIEDARREMTNLRNSLSPSEVAIAESIGISLSTPDDSEQRQIANSKYPELTPQGQIYAQHKRLEHDALERIARDLEMDVPRTDYTSVKALISSGDVPLSSITSDLPISWQAIRELGDKVAAFKEKGKPPKREFLHVEFYTKERGLLEDKKAERDGKWIVSDKHDMLVPYQEPIPLCEFVEFGKPPVQIGEVIVIVQDPTSEWDTEFWRRGGKLDQTFLNTRAGTTPEQLRKAYRRRQIRKASWIVAGVMTVVNIALFFNLFL